jgi:hypothetical protein
MGIDVDDRVSRKDLSCDPLLLTSCCRCLILDCVLISFTNRLDKSPKMSGSNSVPISGAGGSGNPGGVAPTPVNTPLNQAPISQGLSRPTVPDITEAPEESDDPVGTTSRDLSKGLESAMMGMVQGRLGELVGKSSGYVESLPVEVKRSVEGLKGLQVKQDELVGMYKKECLELEKKVGIVVSYRLVSSHLVSSCLILSHLVSSRLVSPPLSLSFVVSFYLILSLTTHNSTSPSTHPSSPAASPSSKAPPSPPPTRSPPAKPNPSKTTKNTPPYPRTPPPPRPSPNSG